MNNQTNSLHLVPIAKLSAAHAALAHARQLSAVIRDRKRGDRLQKIAKRYRLAYNDVLNFVEEGAAQREAKARAEGYRDGVNAARFRTGPPSAAQRRAA